MYFSDGFTLIEVIVGLVISSFIVVIVSGVIGNSSLFSSAANNQNELTRKKTIIRRIIHRDIEEILSDTHISTIDNTAIAYKTKHNMLSTIPFPVNVSFSWKNNKLKRIERNLDIQYYKEHVFFKNMSGCNVEFMGSENNEWISLDVWSQEYFQVNPRAIRFVFKLNDHDSIKIIENI